MSDLEKYEEALQIYRKLAEENPRTYEIDYANTLLMGVIYFKKDNKDLNKAKEILLKYKGIPYADVLLNIVLEIGNKNKCLIRIRKKHYPLSENPLE